MRYKIGFEKALLECEKSPDLFIQLESGKYIYVQSYFCLNQPKYINWHKTIASLTDYAHRHKNECCLPVGTDTVCDQVRETEEKETKSPSPGSKIPPASKKITVKITPGQAGRIEVAGAKPPSSNHEIPPAVTLKPCWRRLRSKVENSEPEKEQTELFKAAVCDEDAITKTLSLDFPETLDKLIKWRHVTEEDLAEASNLSEKTIQRLRRQEFKEASLETIVQLCIGLHLPFTLRNL